MTKPKSTKFVVEGEDKGDGEAHKPLKCPVCSRANPAYAFYCYFDGKPLFKDLQATPLPVGRV